MEPPTKMAVLKSEQCGKVYMRKVQVKTVIPNVTKK